MFNSASYRVLLALVLVILSHPTIGRRISSPVKPGRLIYGKAIGGWRVSNGNLEYIQCSTEFPYMVEVQHPLIDVCGGALIREDAAITAKHCMAVVAPDAYQLSVKAGHLFRDDDNATYVQIRQVKQIISYSEKVEGDDNDLTILQLESPFTMTNYVNTINIPTKRGEYVSESGTMLGWGLTEYGSVSEVLRKISLSVLPGKKCEEMINATKSANHFLCAINDRLRTSCGGDSGGPLVIHYEGKPRKDVLIGILSFSYDDDYYACDSDLPSVTMDVAYYRKWIVSTLDSF